MGEKKKRKLIIIFDEAQELRFFKRRHGIDFANVFGYTYDNLYNMKIILTGSEFGVSLREKGKINDGILKRSIQRLEAMDIWDTKSQKRDEYTE
ncbi:MAG: hypothetical protein J7K51_09240 [Thermotogae bacterium]|nr:hypothetical protein [Thermotogota bacterium]